MLATMKLGPAVRPAFPSGLATDDARALRPLKPSASNFVVACAGLMPTALGLLDAVRTRGLRTSLLVPHSALL
jgi:hypothetical protein